MTTVLTPATTVASTTPSPQHASALVAEAKSMLRSKSGTTDERLALAKRLQKDNHFDFACRVLALAREVRTSDDTLRCLLAQQHALCTYKNPDAPVVDRLDQAIDILQEEINLRTTRDQESLGIAGAIFKRKWQADGAKEHLETSLDYYQRGFAEGPVGTGDGFTYTGINAACVLDVLADIEARQAARTGNPTSKAEELCVRAKDIRRDIVTTLLAKRARDPNSFDSSWWDVATLAEAFFGLEDFANAGVWLANGRAIQDVPQWQVNSTVQQLIVLARLQSKLQVARHTGGKAQLDPLIEPQQAMASPAWSLLQTVFDVPPEVIRSAALGKVGLALSGGGFRASLFHIGVLAALAEHDLLRHVEVLSCVSGGSIVGTHYYLELRRLLESEPSAKITRQHYVDIVQRLEREFLAGVQQNIRMRVFGNLADNWRMFFSRTYSRTQKVGELYERHLYSRVPGTAPEPQFINKLRIQPHDGPQPFHPRSHNFLRTTKVPTLVVNTSSLNSGHQWQFTTAFMGEPPSMINTKVDGNYRLRRMYYEQAPTGFKSIRLGHAVGASSCVPGLFEPMQLRDVFENISVTLVDGGVHDNQGITSLLEQSCDNLIISDASGQMGESSNPEPGSLPVLYRSDTMFQARMRDIQFQDLTSKIRGGVVTATYMHLKQDLEVTAKDWIGCDDPKENAKATSSAVSFTAYDIRKDVQRRLADIRTDLDSFSDAEAHALMVSGYRMTAHNLMERGLAGQRQKSEWEFLYIEEAMRHGDSRLMKILDHAGSIGFKVWGLLTPLRVIARIGLVLALLALGVLAWSTREQPIPFLTLGGVLTSALVAVLTAALGPAIGRALNAPGWLKRAAFGVGVGLFGWAVVLVHLLWFDKWYLAYGHRSKFTSSPPRAS